MGSKRVTTSASPPTIPIKTKRGQMYVAKLQDMWKKFEATGIVLVAIVDLNW